MRYRLLLSALAAAALLAGCGSSASSSAGSSPPGGNGPETVSGIKPAPAGRLPSPISVMVCSNKAQQEIAQVLGVTASVENRTWVNHLYSCDYVYPNGSFRLSVKELSSWDQTFAYFRGLGAQMGNTATLDNLGQGAFSTNNGDVVVRKDWKVLLVDITGLPSQFGVPPTSSSDVAYTVADVILACWAGD